MQRALQIRNGKYADEQASVKINAWMRANPDARIVSITPYTVSTTYNMAHQYFTEFLVLVDLPDGYREIEDNEMECG